MESIFSIILFILLIAAIFGVFYTYKVKNKFLLWVLIILIPFIFIPLLFISPNSPMAMMPWLPFYISLIYSIVVLIKRCIQLLFLKNKSIKKYQFVRPLIVIILFFTIRFFQERSFKLANKLAYELAIEKHQSINVSNNFSPPRSNKMKWESHDDYLLNWSKEKQPYYSINIHIWPLSQRLNYDYNEKDGSFHIAVRYGWQMVFYFRGEKNKELEAFFSNEIGNFKLKYNIKTGGYKKISTKN
jgi:hypothetical protein